MHNCNGHSNNQKKCVNIVFFRLHTLLPFSRWIMKGSFHIQIPSVTASLDLAHAMPLIGSSDVIQSALSFCNRFVRYEFSLQKWYCSSSYIEVWVWCPHQAKTSISQVAKTETFLYKVHKSVFPSAKKTKATAIWRCLFFSEF